MQWLVNPYVIPLIAAGLITVICALFVAQQGRVAGATSLLGLCVSVGIWSFAYAFELASPGLSGEIFWSKVEYIGIPFVPLFFFLFSYEFAQPSKKFSRSNIFLLFLSSSIFTLFAWTNEFHHLIWSQLGQKDMGGYLLLTLEHGIVFWILIIYSYLLLIFGSILIIRRVFTSSPEFKTQSYIVLAGSGVTWLGNIFYISQLGPIPEIDFTPISFMISSLVFSVGLFRFGMLDIMPIAGEYVLESLDDIVMVINSKGILVFVNRAFEYYFKTIPATLIGKRAESALQNWPAIRALVDQNNTIKKEITVASPGITPFIFDVRIFNIRLRLNESLGRVIILNDVTEWRSAESRVAQQQLQNVGSMEIPLTVVYRIGDDKIVDANRSFLLDFGYERQDVLGRSLIDLRFWDSETRADFLRAFPENGGLNNFKLFVKLSNGEKRPYFISASRLEMQNGKYIVLLAKEEPSE